MPQTMLQVNLNFNIPWAQLEAAWLDHAPPIAEQPGLLWKIWLKNEKRNEAAGIYLFESEKAAQAYVDGPLVAALKKSPVVSNISLKLFDVSEKHSAITRGPVGKAFARAAAA